MSRELGSLIYSNTSLSGTVSVPWKAILFDEVPLIGMGLYGKWVFDPQIVFTLDEKSH